MCVSECVCMCVCEREKEIERERERERERKCVCFYDRTIFIISMVSSLLKEIQNGRVGAMTFHRLVFLTSAIMPTSKETSFHQIVIEKNC